MQLAMGATRMGMGKRSAALWPETVRGGLDIGSIDFDPDGGCDPMSFLKPIDTPPVREKLGMA